MNSEPVSGQGRYAGLWLIFISLLAWVSYFGLGTIAVIGGLVWSRRLRPFSKAARIGYWLCWLDLTLFTAISMTVAFTQLGMSNHWEYQIAAYVLSAAIWLPICVKLIPRPARSIGQALLVSLGGMLFLGPALVPTGLVAYMMPTIAGIPWAIFVEQQYDIGGPWLRVLMVLGTGFWVFPAYLAVYWPVQSKANEEKIVEPESPRIS
jgi:hypothetical protein